MPDQKKYISKLAGARVLVIGGSSGIGFGVAEACIEYGALVTVSSSNQDRVNTAVERLKTSYPSATNRVWGLAVDLGQKEGIEDVLEGLLVTAARQMNGDDEQGKLDHVVYTAGDALARLPLEDMTMAKILAAGHLRFFIPLLLARFLPAHLHPCPRSSYSITTGLISEKPVPNWSVIASYAGGHHAMVRNLARDLKPIRVNGVSPGIVDTELWQLSDEARGKFMAERGGELATGRAGRVEDVVESYLALLRDENMDGSVVRTDGGGLVM